MIDLLSLAPLRLAIARVEGSSTLRLTCCDCALRSRRWQKIFSQPKTEDFSSLLNRSAEMRALAHLRISPRASARGGVPCWGLAW
jgi:hypothetical protein